MAKKKIKEVPSLIELIDAAIKEADRLMAEDRNKTLRLRGVVARLNDAKKVVC